MAKSAAAGSPARAAAAAAAAAAAQPAAKRAALAPKTHRTPRKSAASAVSASHQSALDSLAHTLPDSLLIDTDEPTLGERIRTTTAKPRPIQNGHHHHDHEDDLTNGVTKPNAQPNQAEHPDGDGDEITPFPLPAAVSGNPLASSPALSHALTQALHSADKALLSSILAHSDPLLIRSTVQRITGAQALSLLEQLVARLVGASKDGAAGGGAAAANDALARGSSTGKVRTTIEWIRSVLLLHTSYLMALPHLTTRLASLHMALSSRLASHTKLVGLQGRLELVLSQIEIRAAYAAVAGRGAQGVKSRLANAGAGAPASGSKKKGGKGRGRGPADDPTRWIEPSDDEDDDDDDDDDDDEDEDEGMEVDVLNNRDAEDEDEDSDDDEDEDDDDDDEEDDDDSPVLPAEELEDDSEIEDIMLGSTPSSRRRSKSASSRRRQQTILSSSDDDDDQGGDTTADSSGDDEDQAHMARTAREDDDEEDDEDDEDHADYGLVDMEAESTDGEEEEDDEEE
ncbi:unnamed protein product [Tilletia controversa]|nr:unnamed protein product [Tilletia controversa]